MHTHRVWRITLLGGQHVECVDRLSADAVNIPVSGINIGPVHKRDVLRANTMNERGHKKFAVILAFDVAVTKEAREMAQEFNVRIFTADIIYHLFDQVRCPVLSCAVQTARMLSTTFNPP